MRIGLTYTASSSIFSGGRGQTAINLALALRNFEVEFVNIFPKKSELIDNTLDWWIDAPQLPNKKQ